MFEVNFFEKKQKNFLPYVVGGVSVLLLLAVGIYFMLTHMHYERQETANNNWLTEKQEEIDIAEEMRQLDSLTNQVGLSQMTLKENQFPMSGMTEDLVSLIPNEDETIRVFESSELNQVTVTLEAMTVDRISETLEAIKLNAYVERVQMNYLENQHTNEDSYLVEFVIMMDEAAMKEVLQ